MFFIDIIGPFRFGFPGLHVNGPLVLEDVGVRLWVWVKGDRCDVSTVPPLLPWQLLCLAVLFIFLFS